MIGFSSPESGLSSKTQRISTMSLNTKLARLIAQAVISLGGLALSGYLIAAVPDARTWATGLAGLIIGYWIK